MAQQAAGDAMIAILAKLDSFKGLSRETRPSWRRAQRPGSAGGQRATGACSPLDEVAAAVELRDAA